MEVFVAQEYVEDEGDAQILGIFSTEEKADEFIAARKIRTPQFYGSLSFFFYYSVTPYTLDDGSEYTL